MPAISSGKVLVSGANGFIAMWVIKKLLEDGFSVRGTVRSESKGVHLKETFKEYESKLEVVVVEDFTKEGAFDDAVKDVDAIAHTASPVHLHADDPNELIGPAVSGTLGILQSALKHGPRVKRVVVTASTAAVLQADPNPRVFTEEDWNELSLKAVEAKGREATPFEKYCTSKVLAERAAWDFVEKNKGRIGFDLVVVHPPYVFGPVLQEVSAPEKLNSSMQEWWAVVTGRRDKGHLATAGSSWVDVRDLAHAHILSLKAEAAGGNRIIVAVGQFKWQDWVNAAHNIDPKLPAGDTDYNPSKAVHHIRYDVAKANKILGLQYIAMDQTTKDILDDFRAKGWIA